jgi:hypothetical protein
MNPLEVFQKEAPEVASCLPMALDVYDKTA